MFGIRMDLLTGRYVATQYNDRNFAEWPPHPARLFSALVATWAEHQPDSSEGLEELAGLEWLERQSAPGIVADVLHEEGAPGRRTVCSTFVPVNDTAVVQQPDGQREEIKEAEVRLDGAANANERTKAEKLLKSAFEKLEKRTQAAIAAPKSFGAGPISEALQMLPDQRKKQARTFPSVTPTNPFVEFWWLEAPPPSVRNGLLRLFGRLSRVGHSSSLVSAREVTAPVSREPSYRPDPAGDLCLRWVSPGQVQRLRDYHERHQQVETRVMPSVFVSYTDEPPRPEQPMQCSAFGRDWIVLARSSGPRLPVSSAAGLARLLNRAIQSKAEQPVPAFISGHNADGTPLDRPHLAVVALPNVASKHADGAILGLAVVLPTAASEQERRQVMLALAQLEAPEDSGTAERAISLKLGRSGVLRLERVIWERPTQLTLRSGTWTRAAKEWVTATPIALDGNPGNLHDPDPGKRKAAFGAAEASIVQSLQRLGLPTPMHVEVSRSVLLAGAAKPRHYPRFPVDPSRAQRVLVHARLIFSELVSGPVLVGAGRYLGLGLCRPIVHQRRPVIVDLTPVTPAEVLHDV